MTDDTFRFAASDAAELFCYRWLPRGTPRAVVLVAHGMGEHAGRYTTFGEPLAERGYAVFAHDQRGHGRSAAPDSLGVLGPDGWNRMIEDVHELHRHLLGRHPGVPIMLFGHSMGSMVALQYVQRHCDHVRGGPPLGGLVLSGTPGLGSPLSLFMVHTIARFERWRLGADAESTLLQKFLFGDANKAFEGNGAAERSGFEWLSRDPVEVKRYVDDPFCGFVLRAGSLCDLFVGARRATRAEAFTGIPKALPVYVMGGSDDPVHEEQKNLKRLYAAFDAAGLLRVTRKLYRNGRHEMLNEVNRGEVIDDVVKWLDRALEP